MMRKLLTLILLSAPQPLLAAEVDPPRVLDDRLAIEFVAAEPDIVTPTGIAVDDRGRVLVIESHTHFRPDDYQGPPADRIRSFEDRDGDGVLETIGTFFEGTTATMGLAEYHDGSFYVATRNEIFRLRDADGDGRAEERTPIVRLETPGNYPHNGLSGFAFDDRGNVVFGFGENLGAEYKLIGSDGLTLMGGGEGGNVYCCAPDGGRLRRIATGFWNPFHLCLDVFGRLFVVDNDPDSRPPCRLLHIVEGGDYGYRYRNGRKGLHPFTAWNGELPGTLPMVAGTGEAPSGILAYESDNLPSEYLGNLLVTSWGDHRIERYRLEPRGASFVSTMEPLVVGGEHFRPVGIALAPDGSLYISDWVDRSYKLHGQGRIWRLRAKAPGKRKRPTDPRESLASLHRPHREQAARELAKSEPGRKWLAEIVDQDGNVRMRAAALSALSATQPARVSFDKIVRHDSSVDLRVMAARVAPLNDVATLVMDEELKSAPAELRAELLRRPPTEMALMNLRLANLSDPDPFVQHALQQGWRSVPRSRIAMPPVGQVRQPPLERVAAAIAYRHSALPEATAAVATFLEDSDPDVRFVAVQWIAEDGLTQYREPLFETLKAPNTPRRLFDACLAALAMLDGEDPKKFDEDGGEKYVARLVEDSQTAAAIQARALAMLRPDHPSLTASLLTQFVTSEDPELQLAAIRTMRDGPPAARQALVKEVLDSADEFDEQAVSEAILTLSKDSKADRARLLAFADNANRSIREEALRTLRGAKLTPDERSQLTKALAQHAQDAPPDQIAAERELLALIEPRALPPTADPLSADVDEWMTRLEGTGDPAAGERVFHARAVGCARCHQVEGRGGRVGPDLTTIAQVLDRRRLVESIVAPSKEIAPLFVPWTIQTIDGRLLTGLLVAEALDGQQTYADAEGKPFTLKPNEIERREPHDKSLMPAGLERNLTLQELRDLLAYLERRK